MPRSPVALALALIALALPVSIAAVNMGIALLSAALLWRARNDGRKILSVLRSEPALLALVFYVAAGLAAAALCAAPQPALHDAIKDLHRLGSLGIFTAALALEPEAPLLPAFATAFAGMATIGLSQIGLGDSSVWRLTRARGFVHAVVFGEQMALAVLGAACLLLRPDARTRRTTLTAAFLTLTFSALVLNQTRMALIAATFAFIVICVLEPRAHRWAALAVVLLIAAVVAWEFLPIGGRTLSSVFQPYDPKNPQQLRWALWETAWSIFKDHPLTGAGPGGFHRLFTSYYHGGALDNEINWGSAHNLFLNQLAERGLIGLGALLTLFAVLLTRALKAARQAAGARSLWAVAAVVVLLLMSLTETSFQNEQFSTLVLLVWAWGTTGLRQGGQIL